MFMLCNMKDRKRLSIWKWLARNPVMENIIIQLYINQEMCAVLPLIFHFHSTVLNHLFEKRKKSFCKFNAFQCFIMPKTG